MLRMIGHTRGSNCNIIVISIKLGVFKLGSKAFVTFCLPFGGQNYLTELHI